MANEAKIGAIVFVNTGTTAAPIWTALEELENNAVEVEVEKNKPKEGIINNG